MSQRYESKMFGAEPKQVRYLGKCRRCKQPSSALIPHAAYEAAEYMDGRKAFSRTIYKFDWQTTAGPLQAAKVCGCGGEVALRPVKGTYSPDHLCDARCTNAKGPNCECSCGGANHGAAYAA